MTSRNEAHTALVRAALEQLAIRGYTAWGNQTGVWFEEDTGRPHKYGKTGSADIFCILPIPVQSVGRTFGIHAEFEAKTGAAVQKKNQKLHQKFVVERNGGIYVVFRSVEGLFDAIKMAVQPYQIDMPHTPLQ